MPPGQQKAQPMLDIRDGETFVVDPDYVKKALQTKIGVIAVEMQTYMKEVEAECEGTTPADLASLFLSVWCTDTPGPAVLHTRTCLRRAASCRDQIRELTYIHDNIRPGMLLKVSLEQAIKYGLAQSVEGAVHV